jgi:hypothetical protein
MTTTAPEEPHRNSEESDKHSDKSNKDSDESLDTAPPSARNPYLYSSDEDQNQDIHPKKNTETDLRYKLLKKNNK